MNPFFYPIAPFQAPLRESFNPYLIMELIRLSIDVSYVHYGGGGTPTKEIKCFHSGNCYL